MIRTLLANRQRLLRHQLSALETGERLRLGVIGLTVLLGLGYLAQTLLTPLLSQLGQPDFAATIRVEVYRYGTMLCAILGFTTFSLLWRSDELELLGGLPIEPRAMLQYRLIESLVLHLPLLLLSLGVFSPLLWHGAPGLALEAFAALGVMYAGSLLGGMAWHMFAGYSVTTPSYDVLKRRLAGAMVLPERTLLLYSPMLAAGTGFVSGLLVLVGLAALNRGEGLSSQPLFGLGCVAVGLGILPVCWRQAVQRFEEAYYSALGGMSAGELLGELSESAPGPEYVGRFFVDWLPPAFQPLVARDLKQAWRRSRVDHLTLGLAAIFLALACLSRKQSLLESGGLWLAVGLLVTLCCGQAFRLSRPQSDAAWLWMTLPSPLSRQVEARYLATFFFPVMIFPALLVSLGAVGLPWLASLVWLTGLALGGTLLAVNLSLTLFTKRRLGGTLYAVGMLLVMGLGMSGTQGGVEATRGEVSRSLSAGELPWSMMGAVLLLGGLSLGLLKRLPAPLLLDTPTR